MKIRAFAILLCLAMMVLVVPGRTSTSEEPRLLVRLAVSSIEPIRTELETSGYDILRVNAKAKPPTIELVVTRAEWQALVARGYRVTITGRTRPARELVRRSDRTRTTRTAGEVSIEAGVGASSTYLDLDELLARMQQIASAYPAIARVVDITATYSTPVTFEGRHLFALKISDNVADDEDEPAVLVVSAHHAREITTPLITLNAAERLTAGYAADPRIAAAVNGHEIWIAPVWNPDGYNHVFATDNMWRKNRRVFGTGIGVDQNRNYPQGWTASCAGSTNAATETYKGPSAGSEPETQTMTAWSRAERFAKVIDYHSYGREVLYGYLCLSHPFTAWMQQEAAALSRASGYGGATRLPSAEGEHPQWQFANLGAYAFLIETHTEFQPTYASAVSEAALVWPGVLTVIERPISVSGHVTDAVSGVPLSAQIELLNVAFTNGERNSSGGPFGSYHMFLPPGTYDVRFSAPGYQPVTRQVSVTSTSSIVMDVQLPGIPPEAPRNLRLVDITDIAQ
ncbi:MAG TPA: M14 family zinc carboxypeptidase [Vicinamibacterales bacterium]|jgi:hypothetical protein